jgi:hypothetical protein
MWDSAYASINRGPGARELEEGADRMSPLRHERYSEASGHAIVARF